MNTLIQSAGSLRARAGEFFSSPLQNKEGPAAAAVKSKPVCPFLSGASAAAAPAVPVHALQKPAACATGPTSGYVDTSRPQPNAPLTYRSYLQLPQLLDTMGPKTSVLGETLFITVHQAYELWFRETIHDLRALRTALRNGDARTALDAAGMVRAILHLTVAQWAVLDALPRKNFEDFRVALGSSSGLQSAQFREVEMLLGRIEPQRVRNHVDGLVVRQNLLQCCEEPTVYQSFLDFVRHRGHGVEPENVTSASLAAILDKDGDVADIAGLLVGMDTELLKWRHEHIRIVQNMIGSASGTAGTSGIGYLQSNATVLMPTLRDAWMKHSATTSQSPASVAKEIQQ